MSKKTQKQNNDNPNIQMIWKEISDIKERLAVVDERTKNLWKILVVILGGVVGLYIAQLIHP